MKAIDYLSHRHAATLYIFIPIYVRIITKYINWDLEHIEVSVERRIKSLLGAKQNVFKWVYDINTWKKQQICIIWLHVYLYPVDRFCFTACTCVCFVHYFYSMCVPKNRTTKNECVVLRFSHSFVFYTLYYFFHISYFYQYVCVCVCDISRQIN